MRTGFGGRDFLGKEFQVSSLRREGVGFVVGVFGFGGRGGGVSWIETHQL